MSNWIYEGRELKETPKEFYGFIYLLTTTCSKKYIGMKVFHNKVTLPALKNGTIREGAERVGKNVKGKRTYFDVLYKPSDWKTYESSCKELEDYEIASKEIIQMAESKRELNYLEVKHLFIAEAIEDDNFLNGNISGRWFRGNLR